MNDDNENVRMTTRVMAVQALALSVQEWDSLGQNTADNAAAPEELDVAVERITSLLFIRLVAVRAPLGTYKDLSTCTICRSALMERKSWIRPKNDDADDEDEGDDEQEDPELMLQALQELEKFVRFILEHYRDLPFHNWKHAYHVVVSTNKLMDLMLSVSQTRNPDRAPPAFGLRHDPTLLAALLFAALVHDVDHSGVTNAQRVKERDSLALLYNDASIHEMRSLQLSFEEFLKYKKLYKALFPTEDDYRRFRLTVVDAVLATDIANPERAQITKSKFKEAFSSIEPIEGDQSGGNNMVGHLGLQPSYRRGSNLSTVSDVTTDSYAMMMKQHPPPLTNPNPRGGNRRMSIESNCSDYDSVAQMRKHSPKNNNHYHQHYNDQQQHHRYARRRASNQSIDSMYSEYGNDSVVVAKNHNHAHGHLHGGDNGRAYRRPSNMSTESFESHDNDRQQQYRHQHSLPTTPVSATSRTNRMSRRWSTQNSNDYDPSQSGSGRDSHTLMSMAAESIGLTQKRKTGQGCTRQRRFADDVNNNHDADQDFRNGNMMMQYDYYIDDDSSLSLTPPSSDDEFGDTDGVVIPGLFPDSSNTNESNSPRPPIAQINGLHISLPMNGESPILPRTPMGGSRGRIGAVQARRASTGGALPVRFGPLKGRIDENHDTENGKDTGLQKLSTHGDSMHCYRKRLSIRRSMDLSGESIEVYSNHTSNNNRYSIGGMSTYSEMGNGEFTRDYDEPDDLRASVVVELLLRAADVAHHLQSWENLTMWMACLYRELLAMHKAGRGIDVRSGWFDNQFKIVENYLMPLTSQLNEIGVFGEDIGPTFLEGLEENLDRWMVEGFDFLAKLNNVDTSDE